LSGLRVTPFLNIIALVLMVFFCEDPTRGESDTAPAEGKGNTDAVELKNASSWSAYVNDLKYLIFNKTFFLTTLAFTSLTFCTGSLAWFGPQYLEDAINVRTEMGLESPISADS
jgi:small-conductance mechanosensitive channel